MKKNVNDIFLIAMFALCSLIQINISLFDADIKTILVLAGVIIFLAAKLAAGNGFADIKTDPIDIAVYVSGGLALAAMLYKLVIQPEEYGKYMTLLSLCLLYFAVRNYLPDISAEQLFVGSVFQAAVGILLLCHYIVKVDLVRPVSALIQKDGILPWLILMITINVLGFCIDDRREKWYGANAVGGFFLLFIQNNAVATVITGAVLLQTALRYMTRKGTVKRVMQMFFAYAFLLCNMTLITNYTKLLKIEVYYDLELSVYIELVLAVFGVWFFNIWDKSTEENETEDIILPQFRGFFKKLSIIGTIALVVAAAAVIRGRTNILPDVSGKLLELCRQGMEVQAGILETAAVLYGIPGVLLTGYLMYSVLNVLRKDKLLKTSRHRKLFRIVSWAFIIQALFLTQSMASLPIYIIFIAVMLNERNAVDDAAVILNESNVIDKDTEVILNEHNVNAMLKGDSAIVDNAAADQMKGENTDEADNSDSMLQ